MRTTVLALLLTLAAAAPVSTAGSAPGPVRRTILAIYDGARADGPRGTVLHALAEMPLNHLGLVVRYHDIRRGLPAAADLEAIRGVVTWFAAEGLPDPRAYLRFLDRASETGVPVVVIGALGALVDDAGRATPLDDVNRTLARLGWRYDGHWSATTYAARYDVRDGAVIGFERSLPTSVPPFARTRAVSADARAALRVEIPGRADATADVVIVGPRGAFVAPGFAYFSDRTGTREYRQWYLNPFELFREVFDTDRLPKPDTATVSGRRIYYSHIDGDGWRNLTQVEPYRTRYAISARVVLDAVVRRFPDLPVTVGPIVGDLDPVWAGTAESLAVARALFALPHVEAAIHTYSHPLDWGFFAGADSAGREAGYRASADGISGSDVARTGEYAKPRAYDTRPFSLDLEIDEATAFVNGLLPAGKRVRLVQWSGDTRPFEAVLARTRTLGLANINGGDTRFDREFPSAAWVAPLGTRVGRELQVYASNSNENTYTDLWRDRFFGFSYLSRTVRNTGSPRRLKPFNVYYHMYSGERLSSLNAVLANLEYARSLPLAPIEASRFTRIVEGFHSTVFEQEGPATWRVLERGGVQTVRFDGASLSAVDFARSSGVVGQRHELGSLFVTLDEADPAPRVALTRGAPSGREPQATVPYLVESRWRVHHVRRTAGEVRFVAEGFGAGVFAWYWPSDGDVQVQWRATGGRSGQTVALRGADGLVRLEVPQLTGEAVDVRMVGAGPAHVTR